MIFENTGNMSSLVAPKYERNNEGKIGALKTLAHLNDLRKYVNVNDEGRCLVIAWLLISLYQNPNVDAPILWIEGERNTGKTTASKFLKRIVAPDYALMLSQYVNENSLSTALNSQYVSVIDNVSTITPKLNDMLCRAVTDDKIRTVTTENGTFKIRQHANIIVNSLDTVSKTPELRERTFCVRTTNLPPENRLSNEELETSFQKDAPYILGGLIVALWLGLGNKNYAHNGNVNTRLLDACMFVARIANIASKSGFQFTEKEFINALNAQKADMDAVNEEALEDDVIAQTIYEMALEKPATGQEVVIWNETSETLRLEIEKRIQANNNGKTPSDFPTTAQKFGKKLTAISALLSEVGLHIDRTHREGSKRYVQITYMPDVESSENTDETLTQESNEPDIGENLESTATSTKQDEIDAFGFDKPVHDDTDEAQEMKNSESTITVPKKPNDYELASNSDEAQEKTEELSQ